MECFLIAKDLSFEGYKKLSKKGPSLSFGV